LTRKRHWHTLCCILLTSTLAAQQDSEWRAYGRDPGGNRFSPLKQIDRTNVARLKRAWTFSIGEPSRPHEGGGIETAFETTPIVVDGVMYLSTPSHRVIALDPETGRQLWSFDPQEGQTRNRRYLQHRGVSYWQSRDGRRKRILFGTYDGRLIALNATTGKPAPEFGREGTVDLRAGLMDAWPDATYGVTSPPAIYRDLIITGSRLLGGRDGRGPSGEVRAFDVRTGKLAWTFHTIPRPGEAGHETWSGDWWKDRTGANAWSLLSVDEERGLVFIPTAQALGAQQGEGQQLFANSVVALDAATGKRRWHFQMVHHDLWDYDVPAQPNLVTVNLAGRRVPAVAQVTKMGLLFVLDRVTGKPVHPVEERPVPKSTQPGVVTWPTQPFPLMAPLARISMTRNDLSDVTPESQAECAALFDSLRYEGIYTPPAKDTLVFPGTLGGANWSGSSFDPVARRLYVNVQNLGSVWGRGRFWDRNRWPCQKPPWGSLVAVDLDAGRIAWSVPLGIVEELAAKGLTQTGALNIGGSMVTAGGLVFIAATNDRRFRAFDASNGQELWTERLEANGHAAPMTYRGRRTGKQFVVIAAGGGGAYTDRSGDVLAAYALPD
jgi:glucose dehydrogenase